MQVELDSQLGTDEERKKWCPDGLVTKLLSFLATFLHSCATVPEDDGVLEVSGRKEWREAGGGRVEAVTLSILALVDAILAPGTCPPEWVVWREDSLQRSGSKSAKSTQKPPTSFRAVPGGLDRNAPKELLKTDLDFKDGLLKKEIGLCKWGPESSEWKDVCATGSCRAPLCDARYQSVHMQYESCLSRSRGSTLLRGYMWFDSAARQLSWMPRVTVCCAYFAACKVWGNAMPENLSVLENSVTLGSAVLENSVTLGQNTYRYSEGVDYLMCLLQMMYALVPELSRATHNEVRKLLVQRRIQSTATSLRRWCLDMGETPPSESSPAYERLFKERKAVGVDKAVENDKRNRWPDWSQEHASVLRMLPQSSERGFISKHSGSRPGDEKALAELDAFLAA